MEGWKSGRFLLVQWCDVMLGESSKGVDTLLWESNEAEILLYTHKVTTGLVMVKLPVPNTQPHVKTWAENVDAFCVGMARPLHIRNMPLL